LRLSRGAGAWDVPWAAFNALLEACQ